MIKLDWNKEIQDSEVKILKGFQSLTRYQQMDYLDAWIHHLTSIRGLIWRLQAEAEIKKLESEK